MKQFGRLMLLTLGFGLFAVVLSSLPNHPAAAAPNQAVTVVNTSANPVPVAGSVNATLTGTVNAAQSGTWNVGINGNTAATPLFVRDTDNPARQPFVSFCSLSAFPGLGSCNFATVPAGKELVIEMFTVSIRMVVGDKPFSSVLSGAANGTGYNLFYPLSFNGTETGRRMTGRCHSHSRVPTPTQVPLQSASSLRTLSKGFRSNAKYLATWSTCPRRLREGYTETIFRWQAAARIPRRAHADS